MTPPPAGLANIAGSPGQDTVAAATIGQVGPTRCQARTRLYRDGKLEREGHRRGGTKPGWAAIIAVLTLITGFFGMKVRLATRGRALCAQHDGGPQHRSERPIPDAGPGGSVR